MTKQKFPDSWIKQKSVRAGILLFLLLISPPVYAAPENEKPSFKELTKTSAVKDYQSGNLERALAGFLDLEKKFPKNILIKRYLAWIYEGQGLRENAVRKLQEAVELDPQDAASRQMLGESYLKYGELDQASKEFLWVKEHQPGDSAMARQASEKLREVEKLRRQPVSVAGEKMNAQDFLASKAVQDFAAGKYERAIYGFQKMEKVYPRDVLIRRFRGLAWMRLGRYDKAAEALKDALTVDPENAAVYYYLGQVYSLQGKIDEARKAYQWVIQHDTGDYKGRAEKEIFQNIQKRRAQSKVWNLSVVGGYEYDTNATFKSRDGNFSTAGDQNSGRYITNIFGDYQFYQKGRFSLTGDGFYAQTLYNDFPHLQTYTVGAGLSGLYGFNFLSRPVYFNLRNGVMETFLKNRYYVWSNTLTPSFIFILSKRLSATLSHRWVYNRYAQKINTNRPEDNSRTGYTYNPGFSLRYFMNEKRTFYVQTGTDYEYGFTRGTNYRKRAKGAFLTLHFPVLEKIEAETIFRYRNSYYPKTEPETRREDDLFVLTVLLSRPLTDHLTLSAYYSYENTKARDNLYEYYRNVFGIQLQLDY